jgi:hypothetical protein
MCFIVFTERGPEDTRKVPHLGWGRGLKPPHWFDPWKVSAIYLKLALLRSGGQISGKSNLRQGSGVG